MENKDIFSLDTNDKKLRFLNFEISEINEEIEKAKKKRDEAIEKAKNSFDESTKDLYKNIEIFEEKKEEIESLVEKEKAKEDNKNLNEKVKELEEKLKTENNSNAKTKLEKRITNYKERIKNNELLISGSDTERE